VSGRTKRSTRNGWTLVQLVDGVFRVIATGDRDVLYTRRDSVVCGEFPSSAPPGAGVGLYDANGAHREGYPWAPKLAAGGSTRWPAVVPTDGTVAERYVAPPMDPETKRLMDSLRPGKAARQ
jgi:hypothetical protein